MVWAPQVQGNELVQQPGAGRYNFYQLGDRPVRIFPAGTGQPDRVRRKRRSLQPVAIKGYTGSHNPCRVHPVRHCLFQARTATDQPSHRIRVSGPGRIFYF